MLKTRVLTAAVALPPLVAVLVWGPLWLIGLVLLGVGQLAWQEYSTVVGRLHQAILWLGRLTGAAVLAAVAFGRVEFIWPAGLLCLASMVFAALVLYRSRLESFRELERAWAGLWLIYLPLGYMVHLAARPEDGRWWLMFLTALVFAADTGAYFTGRTLGERKLYPEVSPAKTWAGVIGGLIAGGAVGTIAGVLDGRPGEWLVGAAIGLVIAALSMIGDLVISMLKRTYQTKDAGSILPGHGGFLDRLDSFTLAAPALYWILVLKGN